jgi:type VI secretion system secreted protein VgrG
MGYSQDNRMIAIDTPLGKDELLLARFSGSEGMSRLFAFELELLSENHEIDFTKIIGKGVTVRIKLFDNQVRYFHGMISRFSQRSGMPEKGSPVPKLSAYSATMVPSLWMLTRTSDSRIFQNKSVADIIEQVFNDQGFADFEMKLSGAYEKKEYCVQYRETDFNFVSRLMEQEGIFYFFKHQEKKHTLVIADSADENKPCPNQKEARYQIDTSGMESEDKITELVMAQEIMPAKYTVNDYNFKVPNSDLKAEVATRKPLGTGEREIYDYPAKYTSLDEGERLANLRIQAEEARVTTISGAGRCRDFSSGFTFALKDYYRSDMNNKSYLLTGVTHEAEEPVAATGDQGEAVYHNRFTCIPLEVPFRPTRTTPKPVVKGTQPAIVVGPSGEEIYPDSFDRVKVRFIWDRESKSDENSSCWIRVGQPMAGAGWGAMFIPHIGHEVMVGFVEGDPDQPVIMTSVYNGNNKPADTLPDNKTRSVIRSWGDNDIVIEDKDGDKHIQIKQANGNEIVLHEKTPDIEIKQKCGNKMQMKASGPDIEITQACGNEILMREAEGIQIRDKYGNEVVLDAAAGFMRLASPSHNSSLELGKSIQFETDSDHRHLISGDAKFTVLGAGYEFFGGAKAAHTVGLQSDTFVGGKHETLVGAKLTINYAREFIRNYAEHDRKSDATIKYDSEKSIELIGGPGDEGQLTLDKDGAWIGCKGSEIDVDAGSDITLRSKADINLEAKGDITLKSKGTHYIKGKLVTPNIKDNG